MSLPGCEPFSASGGRTGVLVVHGFTGCPQSMRPLADAFAAAGHTVELPLLPGHGTTVEDMVPTRWPDWSGAADAAYIELAGRCDRVFVAGLSMGGTLATWLAVEHPEVAGLVLVNPLLDGDAPGVSAIHDGLSGLADETVPGIGSDIAKPGVVESAYPLTPVRALLSLIEAARELAPRLADVRCPVLLCTSPQDHVVEPVSSDLLASSATGPVTRVELPDSFHVATLDHDAATIEERAVAFVAQHAAG